MTAYLFDIDGVLTDLDKRQLSKQGIIDHIETKLSEGAIIGLISGRALSWIEKRILSVIRTRSEQLYISAEFGGMTETFQGGKQHIVTNHDFALPKDLYMNLEKIGKQFEEYVFVDHGKKTQFTVEATYKKPESVYRSHKKEIGEVLQKAISGYPQLEVLVDLLGTTVKHKMANKKFATSQFLIWMSEHHQEPEQFYAFGDSIADLEIGEELSHHNKKVTFIFVGNNEHINPSHFAFPIYFTKNKYDEGTIEFLESLA